MRRMVVAFAVLLLGACGGGDDGAVFGEGGDAVQVGGDAPDDFPSDIPVPDGAVFGMHDRANNLFQFEVPVPVEEVRSFYETNLAGFEVASSGDPIVDEGLTDFGFEATFPQGEINAIGGGLGTILQITLT